VEREDEAKRQLAAVADRWQEVIDTIRPDDEDE